jgi:hypothetical protein
MTSQTPDTVTTFTGMSLKKRRQAARLWTEWRNAGEGSEVTADRAYKLSGLPRYARHDPDHIVRLTEVAIETVRQGYLTWGAPTTQP